MAGNCLLDLIQVTFKKAEKLENAHHELQHYDHSNRNWLNEEKQLLDQFMFKVKIIISE